MSIDLETVSKEKPWEGTVAEQPDEDTREELNVPEINESVIKTVFEKNMDVVKMIQANQYQALLEKMAFRMRSVLSFMQKEVRVYAEQEISKEESWKSFLDNESTKISAGKFNAVILLLNPAPSQLLLKIITKDKICTICFAQDNQPLEEVSACLALREKSIFEMLNGKKFAEEKKLFLFGSAQSSGNKTSIEDHNKTLNIG